MDQDAIILGAIIGLVIWIFLLYQIIKGAGRSANSEVERLLRILINLKMDEMRKNGFTEDDLKNSIDRGK